MYTTSENFNEIYKLHKLYHSSNEDILKYFILLKLPWDTNFYKYKSVNLPINNGDVDMWINVKGVNNVDHWEKLPFLCIPKLFI